jgi:hypothetical protein
VITVEDLPDQVVVGQPVALTLRFASTGHPDQRFERAGRGQGRRPGGARAAAAKGPAATATLTLPNAGAWTITVYSGFGPSNVTLMPVPAVNAGRATAEPPPPIGASGSSWRRAASPPPPRRGPGERRGQVGRTSGRRFPADYLRQFLADPSIATTRGPGGPEMPNLNLAPREIAALAAFINGERAPQAGE